MAWLEEKTINLADGREVTIRTAMPADARALRAFHLEAFRESRFLIHRPEEYKRSVRDEKRILKRKLASSDELYLLAVANGGLTGVLTSQVDHRRRVRHTVRFGIAVHPDWQGKRLGEAVLRIFIGWAASVDSLQRIELNVTDGNEAAIRLYEKLGFELEGRRLKAIQLEEGNYRDDLIMCRYLQRPMAPLDEV
ncbi:MAG: GNAT family N-acetyltransferase [Sphingomonadales bacterium]